MTDSFGNRPLVTNSLFNVTFETEETSPALIPIALDDDSGLEEIKNDIEFQGQTSSLPALREDKSQEIQMASFENVTPIDVFRDSNSKESTPDPFASEAWLNSHKVIPPPLPQFTEQSTTSSSDFVANRVQNFYTHQSVSLLSQNAGVLDTGDSTGKASFLAQTLTFYNPTSLSTNDSFGNNQVRNSFNTVPTSPPEITLGASTAVAQNGPPPSGNSFALSGTENSYRLSSHKPVYAQYPGLADHTGSASELPWGTLESSQSRPSVFSPPSFFPDTENGPGYSFGAPVPVSTSHGYPQLQQTVYKPVNFHWFYKIETDGRASWKPFSCMDSTALEEGYVSNPTKLVPTDGGRYDVDIQKRSRKTVYWDEDVLYEVRRSNWFYKGPMDSKFIPYEEEFADRLEREYEYAMRTGEWYRRLEMGGAEAIILQNANSIVHYCQAASPDEWGNLPESQLRPRVVKRGVEEFEIEYGEPSQVEFLVFLVHGIGAICDFKFRSITEAVDDFRNLSVHMMRTHFRESVDAGRAGRIEFLPVSWHKALHSDGGIDKKLTPITLPSIPKLRHFTNDTMVDVLLYASPVYCQKIVDTVASEMNRMYNLFVERNQNFKGKVALAGHSLGSVILFDLLAHQKSFSDEKVQENLPHGVQPINLNEEDSSDKPKSYGLGEGISDGGINLTKTPSYTVVSGGTGQPFINYPQLAFKPAGFFAMGSPIGMFLTVRGLDKLGPNFHFPTCPAFFNIFHPYDPVAYRMESLVDDSFNLPPQVIPHHKGRKRFHLELKDTVTRVSADLKNKVLESLRSTWNTVSQLTSFGRTESTNLGTETSGKTPDDWHQSQVIENKGGIDPPEQDTSEPVYIGMLNGGSRIDYVLQESPVEVLNEYLFALTSHVCYWESEDVSLLLLKELYSTVGIFEDGEIRSPSPSLVGPEYSRQHTTASFATSVPANVPLMPPVESPPVPLQPVESMSVPRGLGVNRRLYKPYIPFPEGGTNFNAGLNSFCGMDPTAPPSNSSEAVGPPPVAGFVRKPCLNSPVQLDLPNNVNQN